MRLCMVLQFVFSRVMMEKDFDIKMEQYAVISFFVQKDKNLKETMIRYVMFIMKIYFCQHLTFMMV